MGKSENYRPQDSIRPPYPVHEIAHTLDEHLNLYNLFGVATHPSETRISGTLAPSEIPRSLYSRVRRASLLKRYKSGELTRNNLIIEGHKLDELDKQFSNQKQLLITLPGIGEIGAEYAELNLEIQDNSKPPIFIIPALSGDLYGVEPLMKEAALTGRRVISISYPESHHGVTTDEFERDIKSSDSYEPHTTFFKEAIKSLVGPTEDIELWGYSTGGPIVAEILHDRDFQERTTQGVLIAPASCTDQTKRESSIGLLQEFFNTPRKGRTTAAISVVYGTKIAVDKLNANRRKRIFDYVLYHKVYRESQFWDGARVKENGRIIVVSGSNDQITKSYRRNGAFIASANPQYTVVNYKGATHISPLTDAEHLVYEINRIQNSSHVRYTEIIYR